MAPKRSKLELVQSPPRPEDSSSHEDEDEEEDSRVTPQPHSSSESEPEDSPRTVPEPAATSKAVAKRTRAGKREAKKVEVAVPKPAVRIWGEEEEVSILKGMVKIGPNPDMEALHGLVSESLQAEASQIQLYDKVRRLKRKYCQTVEKVEKDENVSSSWRTHEKKLFDLSRTIWGGEDSSKREKIMPARITGSKAKELEMSATPLVDVESFVTGKGLDLIEGPERAELEERWASLHKAQLKVYVERAKLMLDQAKLVLAAHK